MEPTGYDDPKINDLRSMEIHDVLTPNTKQNVEIMRVPCGWIYRFHDNLNGGLHCTVSNVFVPAY